MPNKRLRRPLGILCLVLGLLFSGTTPLDAKDTELWGAVLLATNQGSGGPLPGELRPCQKQLSKVFGYSMFKVLGESTREFSDAGEQWLIPGNRFSVRAFVEPGKDASYQVAIQLFRDKKELVETVAKLGPRSPLFIRGPLYANGQLIVAIMVRDDD